MHDQESTMEALRLTEKTRALEPAAKEQDRLPPTRILINQYSGTNEFFRISQWTKTGGCLFQKNEDHQDENQAHNN
jgi:hypothetical protein